MISSDFTPQSAVFSIQPRVPSSDTRHQSGLHSRSRPITPSSAWAITAQSAHILLEGAPTNISLEAVTHDLVDHVDGVLDVHHAHLWSLDGRRSMMTLHARIANSAEGPAIVARIKARLKDKHDIDHATVEIEGEDCADGGCA